MLPPARQYTERTIVPGSEMWHRVPGAGEGEMWHRVPEAGEGFTQYHGCARVIFGQDRFKLTRHFNRKLVLGAIAAALAGAVVVAQYVVAMGRGASHMCLVEGPYPTFPRTEAATADGRFSILPLGRSCTWVQDNLIQTVGPPHGWVPTYLAGALLLVAFVCLTAGLLPRERQARPRDAG